jgi:hypothetical protein
MKNAALKTHICLSLANFHESLIFLSTEGYFKVEYSATPGLACKTCQRQTLDIFRTTGVDKKTSYITLTPGGRQAMLTVLEIGIGLESLSKAKSLS